MRRPPAGMDALAGGLIWEKGRERSVPVGKEGDDFPLRIPLT